VIGLKIKKIYDRVVKTAALCIFDKVNDRNPKVMFKNSNKSQKLPLHTVNIFCYFAYIYKLLLLSISIFLFKKCIFICSIRAIHEKYVTVRY